MIHPPRRLLLVCPGNLSAPEEELARGLAVNHDLTTVVFAPGDATGSRLPWRTVVWRTLGKQLGGWEPELVVYASPPLLACHWRVWWWKRRHAPAGLLGGRWRTPGTGERGRATAAWAWDSLDFWLAGSDAQARELSQMGVPPGRVWTAAGGGDAEEIAAFLERRHRAEERSVLWVDEDISLNSPATKPLVYSIPHLAAEGWEVRGWCLSADADAREGVEIHVLPPAPRALRVFVPYWFFAVVNLRGLWQTVLKGRPPARIVQTVGGAFLGADFAAIHFINHLWLRKQWELGIGNRKDLLMFLWTLLAVVKDQLQFSNPRCHMFLPVSDSIGAEVRRRCLPRAAVRTLPNTYDEERFNAPTRQHWREPMRRELGFGEGETVFCFSSQGHYKRKGFWLAVEALARLRRRAAPAKARGVRFLVIGGQPQTLARLQGELAERYPDWAAWLVFVGNQPAVEKYLAAADAFLFPSHFEAFCLGEIEAGALGLPLLLTPHPGTEMILRPGENGLSLPFDPAGMEEVLAGFVAGVLPPFPASAGRALDRAAYARELAGIYDQYAGFPPGARSA